MAYRTIYCAQAFRRQGRGLEKARLRCFADAAEALEAGRTMGGRAPAVLVYRIEIDPDVDLIGEPVTLARYERPREAA